MLSQVVETTDELPLKAIPGSYGVPFFSPIKDRLSFFYHGAHAFFHSLSARHRSTVVRVNMPPGPFISPDPRVVALLDARCYAVLFDLSKVHKHLVLDGTFVPSASLTGGYRTCAYLDPSHPHHFPLKLLLLHHLLSPPRLHAALPSFLAIYSSLLDDVDHRLSLSSPSGAVSFNSLNESAAFEFFGDAFFGVRPSSTPLGRTGPSRSLKWLAVQLHPIASLGLPKPFVVLEDLFLHTFPLPPFLVRSDYKALYDYISSAGSAVLDEAEKLGLARDEACHNLLFATVFNAFGGVKVFFPSLVGRVAEGGSAFHARLAAEVRAVLSAEGGEVTAAALEKMELVKSVVWEALRLDPPVPYQYAKAKKDFEVESHDARFLIREGEMLFGFQPMATRDERVFESGENFVPERFLGVEGRRLLRYVLWSNAPETEEPTPDNKQCAGKDWVVTMGRLLLVVIFMRYDTFTAELQNTGFEMQVKFTSVTRTMK